jgi:hypothetical protein
MLALIQTGQQRHWRWLCILVIEPAALAGLIACPRPFPNLAGDPTGVAGAVIAMVCLATPLTLLI